MKNSVIDNNFAVFALIWKKTLKHVARNYSTDLFLRITASSEGK